MRALLSTLKGRTPASCTFEQWGHFKELQAKDLVEYMNEGLRQTAYEMTMLRTFYPRIDVAVEGKKNPGLQIADFLLWCLVQREFRPSATKKGEWGDWCGLFCWANPGIPEAEARWFHCTVNDGAPADGYDADFLLPYPVGINDIGVAASPDLYALGERTLRLYATGLLPAHAEHLRADLVRVVGRLDGEDVGPQHVRDVATQFLRLFDTVPIYRDIADADPVWLSLMRAKRFFAFALREILLYGGLSDFFAAARRDYLRDDPSALGLSA